MIGARIKARLAELKLTQSYLARQVGVSAPTISELVRGESRSSTHLHAIARVLRTTPAYLTGETDDPSIDAVALAFSPADLEWLDLLRSLSLRDRHAVRVLAETLAGKPHVAGDLDEPLSVPTFQDLRLEYKGEK
ncbi:MAG: helix-turn-helix transcriptional regulator [Methylovirgula sp.]|nr:helix-turn-helix transcriptional regulator [Methylovirgula sp.]